MMEALVFIFNICYCVLFLYGTGDGFCGIECLIAFILILFCNYIFFLLMKWCKRKDNKVVGVSYFFAVGIVVFIIVFWVLIYLLLSHVCNVPFPFV